MSGPGPSAADGGISRRFSRRTFGWAIFLSGVVVPQLYFLIRRRRNQSLVVTLDGPFAYDYSAELEPAEGSYVTPERFEVIDFGGTSAVFNVTFAFNGQEYRSRKIEVMFTARGTDGKILVRETHVCHDQRAFAREHTGKRHGTRIAWVDPRNSEAFMLPAQDLAKVRKVEMRFREV